MKKVFYRSPEGDQSPAIDFDKLTDGDQGGDGSPGLDINNLPDITKQIREQLGGGQGTAGSAAPAAAASAAAPAQGGVPNPLEWLKPYEAFNQTIKTKYTDFELPADLKPEQYNDFVLNFVEGKNAKKIDPKLEQWNELISKGTTIDEIANQHVQNNSFLKMNPEQRMVAHLKAEVGVSDTNPQGLTDDEIADRVSKMKASGTLELQDKTVVDSYKTRQQQELESVKQKNYDAYMIKFNKEEAERMVEVETSLQNFNNLNNIAGIPITQSDKEEYSNIFKTIAKRDANTGLSILDALLQSNEFLSKAIYLGLKAEPKIRQAITEAKEGVKKNFMDKLGDQPDIGKGQTGAGNPLKVDLDALTTPEHSY